MAKNVFCAIAAAWLAVFLFVSTAAGDGFPAAKIVRIYFQDDTIARFDLLPLHLGIEEVARAGSRLMPRIGKSRRPTRWATMWTFYGKTLEIAPPNAARKWNVMTDGRATPPQSR